MGLGLGLGLGFGLVLVGEGLDCPILRVGLDAVGATGSGAGTGAGAGEAAGMVVVLERAGGVVFTSRD